MRFVLVLFSMLIVSGCGSQPLSSVSDINADLPFDLIIGSSEDPELIPPGPGAGEWNSERATSSNRFLKSSAQAYLRTSQARATHGPDAVDTFAHYFENHGEDFEVDVARLLADVESVGATWAEIKAGVSNWAAAQAEDSFIFTSADADVSGITKAESENWYLAIAGFSYWVKGQVETIDGERQLSLELHIWDRYDWDPGVVVPIDTPFGTIRVDQDRVAEFHRQGLAKEYDSVGILVEQPISL